MRDCLRGPPRALHTNSGKPATNPPSSPSTTQAIILPTTQISIITNVRTTTSHTQPHISGYLHHTNTPTSSKNFKKSKNSKNPHQITILKRHAPTATNMFPATYIKLKRPKKPTLSFQHRKTIFQQDHNTSLKSSSTTTTRNPQYLIQKPLPHNQLPSILPTLSLLPQPPTIPQPIPTPSVPSTPTLLPMPPGPITPVHKPTSQYPP